MSRINRTCRADASGPLTNLSGCATQCLRVARAGRTVFLACALALVASVTTAADRYTLGAGDKLQISVYERRDLTGKYSVRPPGELSVPGLGTIDVRGLGPSEVEAILDAKLQGDGPQRRHLVSVEVLEHRPFFIVGQVRNPGAYPYLNGLTVLQAIAIAGGIRTVQQEFGIAGFAIVSNATEKLRVLAQQAGVLLARQRRLIAEQRGDAKVEFPDQIKDYLTASQFERTTASQRAIFEQRRQALSEEVANVQQRRAVFESEIKARRSQIQSQRREAQLLRQELDKLESGTRGTVVPLTHVLGLKRLAARTQGEIRNLEAFIARAEAETREMDRRRLVLENNFRSNIVSSLHDVESELAEKWIQIDEARRLVARAEGRLPDTTRPDNRFTAPRFAIVRDTEGVLEEIPATELTRVKPGDTVKVLLSGMPSNQLSLDVKLK